MHHCTLHACCKLPSWTHGSSLPSKEALFCILVKLCYESKFCWDCNGVPNSPLTVMKVSVRWLFKEETNAKSDPGVCWLWSLCYATDVYWQMCCLKHLKINLSEGLYRGALYMCCTCSMVTRSAVLFLVFFSACASAVWGFSPSQLSRNSAVLWYQLETGFQLLSFTRKRPLI